MSFYTELSTLVGLTAEFRFISIIKHKRLCRTVRGLATIPLFTLWGFSRFFYFSSITMWALYLMIACH